MSSIINAFLTSNIQYHEAIHGFRVGRGTGTALLEAKLLNGLAKKEGRTLYQVFLDISKAYYSIDREQMLYILEGYGVGSNLRRLLINFWEAQVVAVRQKDFFGTTFKSHRGVTQGDIISPTIFNIMIDAVVRVLEQEIKKREKSIVTTSQIFYADDGYIAGVDECRVQETMNDAVLLFERLGLYINCEKTKLMVGDIGKLQTQISKEAYDRRVTGRGKVYELRMTKKLIVQYAGKRCKRGIW